MRSTWALDALYCINRTGTAAAVDCRYQQDWFWDSSGPRGIGRAGTGAVVDCRVSVGLVLGQGWTVGYQ